MFAISVGARQSPLSQAQVKEVLREIQTHHPHISFSPIFVQTHGDIDQKTSLRSLDKTDFFTREVDELLISGKCRIAVHSAKDLPEPLPKGLCVAALTAGLTSVDSLVFKYKLLDSLPSGALVATSSVRREEAVSQLRKDLKFIDLRGTITQRLAKLDTGEADAVVIAEAALIRLQLTHLNRVHLPGETVANQGKLAVVCLEADQEMLNLFASIDSRKNS